MKTPIMITDSQELMVERQKYNIKHKMFQFFINKKKFVIPKILCFPNMHGDILLENNFPSNYLPMQFHLKHVGLTLKKELATK